MARASDPHASYESRDRFLLRQLTVDGPLLLGCEPRRRRLLEDAGFAPRVSVADIDDGRLAPGSTPPPAWAMALAYLKVQNPFVPVAFLTGGFFSGLCGFLGMKTATNASARTAQGASEGLNRGLQVAFRSGAVMGLVVVGFGLLDISLWYLILDKIVYTTEHMETGMRFLGLQLVPEKMDEHHKLVEITTTIVPRLNVGTPFGSSAHPVVETKLTPAGRVSVTWTFSASEGPLLLTVTV